MSECLPNHIMIIENTGAVLFLFFISFANYDHRALKKLLLVVLCQLRSSVRSLLIVHPHLRALIVESLLTVRFTRTVADFEIKLVPVLLLLQL
jgi:hypothetical protein